MHSPDYPVIISENGIPTSLGTSHSGYGNRWHGHMTEAQQAQNIVDMATYMVQNGTWSKQSHDLARGRDGAC